MNNMKMSDVFKKHLEMLEVHDSIYVYEGSPVYIGSVQFAKRKPNDIMLEFFFLNSKMKETNKRACTVWYDNFVEYLNRGIMKKFSGEKPLPTRMAGKSYIIFEGKDRSSVAIVTTGKKIFLITGGYAGWSYTGREFIRKHIEARCFINRSSHGVGVTDTTGQKYGTVVFRRGQNIKEITQDEMDRIIFEHSL